MAPLVQFDPRFLLLLKILWVLVTFPFKALYFIYKGIRKAISYFRGRSEPLQSASAEFNMEEASAISPTKSPRDLTDSRAFLSYGGVLWVSELTPQALKKELLANFPEDEVVTIKYLLNKEEKILDFTITGLVSHDEARALGELISDILQAKKSNECGLHAILSCENLGKFLDKNGVPDRSVPGFSIDNDGAILVSRYVIQDQRLSRMFLEKIFDDDYNYTLQRAKAREAIWNQAATIAARLKGAPYYSPPDSRRPHGSFYSHHIIDLDTPVTDGISMGHPAREAIWVDSSSQVLEGVFEKLHSLVRRLKEALGPRLEEKVLTHILELVRQSLPRDTEQAIKGLRESMRISPDQEVSLDTFLSHETGDSEHQALLAAYLLERLQKELSQYLRGKISVDRNWLPGGGHAWVRYTASPDDVYIIDPKRSYLGRLDDYSTDRWPYQRPGDLPLPRRVRPIQ